MPKKTTRRNLRGEAKSRVAMGRPSRGEVVSVGAKLPLAYLSILETEAKFFEISRGQFLTMLLKRKLGELSFERPKAAPDGYKVSDAQLKETKLYIWYVSPNTKKLLDADRLQMGNVGPAVWIMASLNEWVGRPKGLRRS